MVYLESLVVLMVFILWLVTIGYGATELMDWMDGESVSIIGRISAIILVLSILAPFYLCTTVLVMSWGAK